MKGTIRGGGSEEGRRGRGGGGEGARRRISTLTKISRQFKNK